MMPTFSASSIAAALTFSWLIRASHSCSKSTARASATVIPPAVFFGRIFSNIPLQVDVHLLHAHAGEHHGHGLLLELQLDAPLVHLAGGQHRPHLLAGPLVAVGRLGAVGRGVEAERRLGASRSSSRS